MNNDTYNKLKQTVQTNDKISAEKHKVISKQRLRKVIETKLRTTMIGAIDKIEKFIGEKFWGYGLDEKDCTEAQLDNEVIWEQLRDEILNLGNKQIRAMLSELDLYDIFWSGYKYHFSVKQQNY